jgi:ubiquinone/menaquinone biosynthesis C-methylase UbiE
MTVTTSADQNPQKFGLILHAAASYDLFVRLVTLGRERNFRDRLVDLAGLRPGDRVLDVGCGTGSLAIVAQRRVGLAGGVFGIDASPEMIARAERKARKAGAVIDFREAAAQKLPFPDAHFDAVLSTVMFHHLSRTGRQECAAEMRRVLKPGGRALVVDFAASARRGGLLGHIHQRPGHVSHDDMVAVLSQAGLNCVESGAVGVLGLHFALAAPACCA